MRRQSEHLADYARRWSGCGARGLVYRCFRTRKEVAGRDRPRPARRQEAFRGAPLPPAEEAARLAAGEPFAWRLSLAAARRALGGLRPDASSRDWRGPGGEHGDRSRPTRSWRGDVVLARKDVGVAYHLAVVVDDALQGITDVVRGQDLFEATHVQRLLQALLGLPTPPTATTGCCSAPTASARQARPAPRPCASCARAA